MSQKAIIILVIVLMAAGIVAWFLFFSQGALLGTAIGLNKNGTTTSPTAVDWNKYMTRIDSRTIQLKNGATGSISVNDKSKVEVKVPGIGTEQYSSLSCYCVKDDGKECTGNCPDPFHEGQYWICPSGYCYTECGSSKECSIHLNSGGLEIKIGGGN